MLLAAALVAGCGGPRTLDTGERLTAGPHEEPAAVWSRDLGRALEFPPVPIGGDWLVVVTEGPLRRLRPEDGEDRWRCKLPGAALGVPVLCGNTAVIGTESPGGRLLGVDLESGEIRWKTDARGALAAGRDTVLVAAGRGGWVARFDPATGERRWEAERPGSGWRAPVVRPADGLTLVSVRPDSVVALALADGARRWAARIGPWPHVSGNDAGPVAVLGEAGELALLEPDDGAVLARRDLDGRPAGPPVIAGDRVIVALRDGRLLALRAGDLEPVWSRTLGAPLVSPPVVNGGRIAQASPRGRVVVLDADSGATIEERRHPEKLLAAGAWAGDRLAVGGAKGTLVLYRRTP